MTEIISTLVICALLAVFAVWKEYKRPAKAHLLWRILCSVAAAVALACVILPVSYLQDIAVAGKHDAVLLTDGFDPDSMANYKNDRLLTTEREIAKKYTRIRLIRPDELKADSPTISRLHVLGNGLAENELDGLDGLPVIFYPSTKITGIAQVNWNQELNAGEALKVQGRYNNGTAQRVKLALNGLDTQLDTITIAPHSDREFELNAIPKNTGRSVYHLQAISGTDTLADEQVPVNIKPVIPLKVLLLSASPDFETKFLKNWLSENGFSVAVRSAISKDKFNADFVNMEPLKMDHLNPSLLSRFDLVIGDLSVLRTEDALKQEVMQKGLGLIILADTISKASSWLQQDFPLEHLQVKDAPVPLIIRGKKDKTAGLKTGTQFIRYQAGTQTLVNDAQGHVAAASGLAGVGRLVFTTINGSYNWMLAGDQTDYSAFWSLLIGNAARKTPVTEGWSVAEQMPSVDEPVSIQLVSSSAPLSILAENTKVAPIQNPFIPFEWANTYWPSSAGWHSIAQKNGKPAWYYIYEKDDWRQVKAAEKIAATRRYAENYAANENVTKAIHENVRIEVPKIYFYLLLLAACVYLWVEGKRAPPNPPR